ncbi:MAG: GNAT family N-acetyltransferase [Anaerolineales bacterium]
MESVAIRPVTDIETFRALEELQQRTWGMPNREIVPYYQLLAAAAAGGVVLGAFMPEEPTPIGFCYAFVGLRDGRPFLYSHMAAVAPEYRGSGVGYALKRAQREAALARGLDRIIWTYDPLQAANAHFNLRKLGAEAGRYFVNYYGAMEDDLNRGGESDRLEVDWWLAAPRVSAAVEGHIRPAVAGAEEAPVALGSAGDPPRPEEWDQLLQAPAVRIAVPSNYTAILRLDPALALAWREASRRVFLRYFERGYVAVDFLRGGEGGSYVLAAGRAGDGRAG